MPLIQIALLGLKACAAAGCIVAATMVRAPVAAQFRPWLMPGVLLIAALLAGLSLRWRHGSRQSWIDRFELAPFGLAVVALLVTLGTEGKFWLARETVRWAEPSAVERLGQHIIVGYRDQAFVRELVERRAIAGIFLSQANVARRDPATIARDIAELQAIRARQGLPPLWITTDQEGGIVSRLSPPIPYQPALARVIAGKKDEALRTAVSDYAATQGRALAALGINLNFAPVIDLDFGKHNPDDAFTRIAERAISADANVVSDVADAYCDGLAAQGVRCTFKHFPGLGRVFDDTHRTEGTLEASREELERADWIPFRRMLARPDSFVMVGHVRLAAIDATQPASTSSRTIDGLIRRAWGYDGIVLTDDMCMGAIYSGPDGIQRASLRALNAGVDLLLVSWDGEQVYPILAALLRAGNDLDAPTLRRSADRLRAAQSAPRAGLATR